MRAGQYTYRDRRNKKRGFRAIVDCAYQRRSPPAGLTHSTFMGALKRLTIEIDHKVLADMAVVGARRRLPRSWSA